MAPEPRAGAMNAAADRAGQRPRGTGWVTAAAVILLAEGVLGLLYVPSLVNGSLGSFLGVGALVVGIAVLGIAAGVGLLRRHGWARPAAGPRTAGPGT